MLIEPASGLCDFNVLIKHHASKDSLSRTHHQGTIDAQATTLTDRTDVPGTQQYDVLLAPPKFFQKHPRTGKPGDIHTLSHFSDLIWSPPRPRIARLN